MIFSDPYIFTSCSAQNGVNIYNHGIANGQPTPTDCSMLLDTENIQSQRVTFSPNPFKTELFITTTFSFEKSTVKIFNSFGQLVKELNNINGETLIMKRENLSSGIYFAQLIQNEKLVSTHKIIVSD